MRRGRGREGKGPTILISLIPLYINKLCIPPYISRRTRLPDAETASVAVGGVRTNATAFSLGHDSNCPRV